MRKKLFVLIIFAAFSLPTFAVITPEEATSNQYLQNHGHSNEMSRLIDLQNAQVNNKEATYKPSQEYWQTVNYPKWCTPKKISFIRKVFTYFDGGLDDGKFMRNNINYTNRWDDL